MALNRTQKRLLWLFKEYGERDPITALYTWVIAHSRWSPAPFDAAPSLAKFFRTTGGSLGQFGPGPDSTVGQLIHWAVGYAQVRTEQEGSFQDTACAKMIPTWARWVAQDFQQTGWPGRISQWWDVPLRELQGPTSAADRREAEAAGRRAVAEARGTPGQQRALVEFEAAQGGLGPLELAPSPTFLANVNEIMGSVQYLCDWYLGARPDLGRYPTYASATAAAYEWHEAIERKVVSAIERGPVVYKWDDGWTVQELTNRTMFVQEGTVLGHCIAGGEYLDAMRAGTSRYFSLRRPDGEPWVTIEVNAPDQRSWRGTHSTYPSGSTATVDQIKGCKNRLPGTPAHSRDCPPPDPTECTRVFDFLNAAGSAWELGYDYAGCWGYTAAAIGLPPKVQARETSGFSVGELVRPPSSPPLEVGQETKKLRPQWWRG